MARQPSSIDRLPEEIRAEVARLRRANCTIDEIVDHLRTLDVTVSRSAVGRHLKSMDQIGEAMRRADTISKFVVEKFGEETDDRVARASMQVLQGALLEMIVEDRTDDDGRPITLSVEEAKSLSLAIQRLVTAQRMDAERELKVQAEFARRTAAKVGELGKQMGWSAETAQRVRSEILGVRDAPAK